MSDQQPPCDRTHPWAPAPAIRAQPDLPELAALVRELRAEASLSTRQLAIRSTINRSTIMRVQAGKLQPRKSMLAALAWGIDPDHAPEILEWLVAAAGDQMAAETSGWRRYRKRRLNRRMRARTVPLQAEVERHQAADAFEREAMALQRRPGFWRDRNAMQQAHDMLTLAAQIRAQSGPRVTAVQARHRVRDAMEGS